jgi:hypothetical protein
MHHEDRGAGRGAWNDDLTVHAPLLRTEEPPFAFYCNREEQSRDTTTVDTTPADCQAASNFHFHLHLRSTVYRPGHV